MSITAGQTAIMTKLAQMPDAPNIVWPDPQGGFASAALPRIVMEPVGGAQQTKTIKGETRAEPEISARVETESGQFSQEHTAIVAAIVARFPPGLPKFDGVSVTRRPDVRPAFSEGGVYVTPVFIRGVIHY